MKTSKPFATHLALSTLAGLAISSPTRAVVFYGTADPTHNVVHSAADHSLAKYVGTWGGVTGTPIAPQYFITTKHAGSAATFSLNGTTYNVANSGGGGLAIFNDSNLSDLRIVKIDGTFADDEIAPLYSDSDEVGKPLVVFGRGVQRGAAVEVPGASVSELRGWQWGPADGLVRWGENAVAGVTDYQETSGPLSTGVLLYATFDRLGLAEEAHLTTGDSGGPVFIDGKLAGINYAVDGRWRSDGSPFNAVIFDGGGLEVEQSPNTFEPIADVDADVPSAFYASRVSGRMEFIESVIAVPEPLAYAAFTGACLVGIAGFRAARRFARTG